MRDKNNKRIDVRRAKLYKQIQIYHTWFCGKRKYNVILNLCYSIYSIAGDIQHI